jgi:hypothetical protein
MTNVKLDGVSTVEADLIQMDFVAASFDRRPMGPGASDPTIETIVSVANHWLMRYRVLLNAPMVSPAAALSWPIGQRPELL